MSFGTRSNTLVIRRSRPVAGDGTNYAGWHALMPILLGLSVPGLCLALAAPELATDAWTILGIYLVSIFVASAVVFVRSVFNPGELVEAAFDPKSRSLTLTMAGTFGTTTEKLAFQRIAEVYVDVRFDNGGGKVLVPLLRLKNDAEIVLPDGTTDRDLTAIRALLAAS